MIEVKLDFIYRQKIMARLTPTLSRFKVTWGQIGTMLPMGKYSPIDILALFQNI